MRTIKKKSISKVWNEKTSVMVNSGYDRDHSFSMFEKFSKKVRFLTPRYEHVRVGIKG